MSYKESEEENAAQADSNDSQQQGRKRKLKAMEDEASTKKVVAVQCNVRKYYCHPFLSNLQCVTQVTGGLASVEAAQVENETKCLLCAAEVGQVFF